jgi:hypothetical protein
MSTIALIHQNQRQEVTGVQLLNKCSLFNTNLALLAGPYTVHSTVTPEIFREFVASLEDKPVQITNANFSGLCCLSDEFGDIVLAAKLADFRQSPDFLDLSEMNDIKNHATILKLLSRLESDATRIEALEGELATRQKAVEQLSLDVEALRADLSALRTQPRPIHNAAFAAVPSLD